MEADHLPTKAQQTVLSCTLFFITGATFSVGAFTLPVERVSRPLSALAGVWPASTEYVHLFSAPLMVLTGLLLAKCAPSRRGPYTRVLSACASICFALFGIAAPAVAASTALLVRAAVAFLAVPLGIYTVIVAEHLLRWIPQRPGLAMALMAVSFNSGIIASVWMFEALLRALSVVRAIAASAAIMCACTLVPTVFLRYPAEAEAEAEEFEEVDGSAEPLMPSGFAFPKLSVLDAAKLPSFWLFMFCAMSAGATYALTPYFFRLGSLFGESARTVSFAFQVTSFVALLGCLVLSVLTDRLQTGHGALSSGARNVLAGLIAVQLVTCIGLLRVGAGGFFEFAVATGVLKMIVITHNCCVALLAVEMFGQENVPLVYGVGGGLSIGTGEGLSVQMLAVLDEGNGLQSVESVRPYYGQVAVWSAAALVAVLLMRKNKVRVGKQGRHVNKGDVNSL